MAKSLAGKNESFSRLPTGDLGSLPGQYCRSGPDTRHAAACGVAIEYAEVTDAAREGALLRPEAQKGAAWHGRTLILATGTFDAAYPALGARTPNWLRDRDGETL